MIRTPVILALATLALGFAQSPASAAETPHATSLDHRIREAVYNDREVFEIPGVFRTATEIVFSKDEAVEHVALGDSISWEVAPAGHSLFIKPREMAGATNLTVITRSRYGPRSYRFALSQPKRGAGFYTVFFRYPQQEAAERHRMDAQAKLAALDAAEQGAITRALDIGVLEGARNSNYTLQGSTRIEPSEVSDNGQFTVLRFPNQRELPAFFTVQPDGSETIASFDVRDEYVVLHGVYRTIRLRRGREVLCIHNKAMPDFGRDPKTGTASDLVERSVVEE